MTRAYNNTHDISIDQLPTTHLYVQFCPSTLEELELLDDADLNLMDFDLLYEVINMGDYNPAQMNEQFPCFWTVVEHSSELPNVPYDILDPLHLPEPNDTIIKEAFNLTNNDYLPDNLCEETDPRWPECQCDIVISNPAAWRACMDDLFTPPPPSGPCVNKTNNTRSPSGRITVMDKQNGVEGVRDVKVTAWDGWFYFKNSQTDDNGCFRLDYKYSERKIHVWVTFKNDRCKIRGGFIGAINPFTSFTLTLRDYLGHRSFPFNNINVNYTDSAPTNLNDPIHAYWGASTINNALHEFHDYASADGINTPPNGLNILIGDEGGGAALMSKKLPPFVAISAMGFGAVNNIPVNSTIQFLTPFIVAFNFPMHVATLNALLPDVYIALQGASDLTKSLAYHEFAHTSHFTQVGNSYWIDLIGAESAALGHGTVASAGAGIISVCESWAGHLEHDFAHRQYGGSSSFTIGFQVREERIRNESFSHIPIGLYKDLADTNGSTETTFDFAGGSFLVRDFVSGFTNIQMFSVLTSSTTSIPGFQTRLRTTVGLGGNTLASYNTLFLDY